MLAEGMRGVDQQQNHIFSYLSPEERVRKDHPLRVIRTMVDEVLKRLSRRFDAMYARVGRRSIPPEHLLRAHLLQMLYSIRSERLLMEELDCSMLFRWFVGLTSDEHFTVDGTLLEAWASLKSFQSKDEKQRPPDDPGNPTVNVRGALSLIDFHDPYKEAQLRGRVVERRPPTAISSTWTPPRTSTRASRSRSAAPKEGWRS